MKTRITSQSRRPRPILYIYKDPHERQCSWLHGVTFHEFRAALVIRRPLLVFHEGIEMEGMVEDRRTGGDLVDSRAIDQLARQDIYSATGDFIWFDFPSLSQLNRISDKDVAVLLYFKHAYKPLGSPFLRSLKNDFAYLAHDDGWMLKFYCRRQDSMTALLDGLIRIKANQFLQMTPHGPNIGKSILKLATKGVALDFRPLKTHPGLIRISQPGPLNQQRSLDQMQTFLMNTTLPPLVATISSNGFLPA